MANKVVLGGLTVLGLSLFLGLGWIKSQEKQTIAEVKTQINELEQKNRVLDLETLKATRNKIKSANKRIEETPQIPLISATEEIQKLRSKLAEIEQRIQPETQALTNLEAAQKLAMEASILVQNPPHPTQVWLDAKQKWNQAIRLLQEIPRGTYAFPEAQQKLSSYRQNFTIISQKAEMAEQAVQLNNQALKQIELGQHKQAIITLNKATNLNPGLLESYLNRGIIYTQLNSNQSAISNFSQAIKVNPKSAEAYYFRGDRYLEQGNYNQALSDYNKAIELNSEYTDAYLDRGFIYTEVDDQQKAINDFQKASELLENQGDLETQQLALSVIEELKLSIPNNLPDVDDDDDDDHKKLKRRTKIFIESRSRIRNRRRR